MTGWTTIVMGKSTRILLRKRQPVESIVCDAFGETQCSMESSSIPVLHRLWLQMIQFATGSIMTAMERWTKIM